MWETTVDVCVTWWLKKFKASSALPDPESRVYQDYRQQALFMLRSGIQNNMGLPVLEYAAYQGLSDCVHIMLTQQDVFILQRQGRLHSTKDSTDCKQMFIEVTCLTKECTQMVINQPNKSNNAGVSDGEFYPVISTESFMDIMANMNPPQRSGSILTTFPLAQLAEAQWAVYQWFYIGFILVHTLVMVWYTEESKDCLKDVFNITNSTADVDLMNPSDIFLILYSFIFLAFILTFALMPLCSPSSSENKLKQTKLRTFSKYGHTPEDKGSIMNILTGLVAFICQYFTEVLLLVFALSSIVTVIAVGSESVSVETMIACKSIVMVSGWLILLTLLPVFSPIHVFITFLKHVIIKDMVPFLLFLIIISVAFGAAIQVNTY